MDGTWSVDVLVACAWQVLFFESLLHAVQAWFMLESADMGMWH